jgi:membrane-associated phospholipid phosphatase
MEKTLIWGIELIKAIQTIENPVLTVIMKTITALGSEFAYLAIIPLVYWCVDERKGVRLGVTLLLSAWLNSVLKTAWKQPRPYELEPSVGRALEKSYGLPSGHAQGSMTFWGLVGSWVKAPFGLILAIGLPLLIGFTRLYLGVHFPTDVLMGWLLGAGVLALYFLLGDRLERILSASNIRIQLLIVVAVAFLMNALHPEDTSLGGVFFGMGAGFLLMKAKFPFSARLGADGQTAKVASLAIRYLLGLAVSAALYLGLKKVFPGETSNSYALFRFLRYGLVGVWVSAGAPWVFLRLKLMGIRF